MTTELRKTLNNFLRLCPGYENLTDKEVEEKAHNDFMKIKLTEPLHWSSGWRKSCAHMRGHILEDDEDIITFL